MTGWMTRLRPAPRAQADGHPATTFQRVLDTLERIGVVSSVEITTETRLLDDLCIDEFAVAILANQIEDDHDVTVPDRIAVRWVSVGDVSTWLDAQLHPVSAEQITS